MVASCQVSAVNFQLNMHSNQVFVIFFGFEFLFGYTLSLTLDGLISRGVNASNNYKNFDDIAINNESDLLIDSGIHNKSKVDYFNDQWFDRLNVHSLDWEPEFVNTSKTNRLKYAISN